MEEERRSDKNVASGAYYIRLAPLFFPGTPLSEGAFLAHTWPPLLSIIVNGFYARATAASRVISDPGAFDVHPRLNRPRGHPMRVERAIIIISSRSQNDSGYVSLPLAQRGLWDANCIKIS